MVAVDGAQGLSDEEVLARRETYGMNCMPKKDKVPLWKRFIEQFDDKMVHILLAAAGISVFFSPEVKEKSFQSRMIFLKTYFLCFLGFFFFTVRAKRYLVATIQ